MAQIAGRASAAHTKFLIKHLVARIYIRIQQAASSSCESIRGAFVAAATAAAAKTASVKNAINVKCASKLCAK